MKQTQKISAVIMMFLLIGVLLLTSFQVAIYGDSQYRFYEREYKKYQVADSLNMTMDNIMDVTDQMMAYLIGNKAELSVITDVDGETQDFFNEQDRLHLADVRNLFLGGLKLRNYAVILATILMIVLMAKKADFRRLVPQGYLQALFVYLILAAILGVAMSIDFTSCFTLFHKLFFTNNLWIFDPETDYMIRMLPEGFFSDMVIRVGVIFIVLLAVPGVTAVVYSWKRKKKEISKTYKRI